AAQMRCFFFSSRRRHTRWPRDWSSDVCSSDLPALPAVEREVHAGKPDRVVRRVEAGAPLRCVVRRTRPPVDEVVHPGREHVRMRSEERRVGKEWRSRRKQEEEGKKEDDVTGMK